MAKIRDWISLLPLWLSIGALAEPLMPAENFIPQTREDVLLAPEELRQIENYRKDTYSYTSARLFLANMGALRSEVVDVEIGGKSQRYFAWERSSVTQDPTTQKITEHGPDYAGADGYFSWTGSTSLPAKGRPTARFSWEGWAIMDSRANSSWTA